MITRRGFMKVIVGGLTAVKVGLGKSEQKIPDAKLPIDDQPVLEFPKGVWHISGEGCHTHEIPPDKRGNHDHCAYLKASELESDGLTASEIKVNMINPTEYNVIDDLVDEMNQYDIKYEELLNL